MPTRLRVFACAAIALLALGCNKSNDPAAQQTTSGGAAASSPSASPQDLDAKVVVASFLEAIRKGDNDMAMKLLTKVARQKAAESGKSVAPQPSDTARFEVIDATYPTAGHDIAHVRSTWTDIDETGKPRTDKATWICRLEPEGWRVAAFAAYVFEGEDPLLLPFEDPEEMARKQAWLKEETARRAKQEAGGTSGTVNPSQAERNPQDEFRR